MLRSTFLLCLFLAGHPVRAVDEAPANARDHRARDVANEFQVTVPAHAFDLVPVRPEKNSVTLSVLAYGDLEGYVAYGLQAGKPAMQTPLQQFKKGEPVEVLISGLKENSAYYYQFRSRPSGVKEFANSPESTFHTARPPGASFTFTLTADAHLDEHTSPEVYLQTLANIRNDRPDFHIDLGNLFMTDKHASREEAAAQYLAQRYYLAQISSPILLALGTHDGESGKDEDGSDDCLAAWSNRIRKRLFPNPVPNEFYSGNKTPRTPGGLLQNYYAWEWGDALFIVLDPFRHSIRQHGGGDGWAWSLGAAQYQWLEQTLRQSRSKFKFVFIHNLLCGDQAARGGVEVASLNEWGGKNPDGSDGFRDRRPGWDAPVHRMLVQNHVTVLFKAHDNFFARQDLDGLVYLMVPQPSFAGNDRIRDLETYGYKSGMFLGNSGHVRVTVSPEKLEINYIRSVLPKDENGPLKNGAVADRHEITAPK